MKLVQTNQFGFLGQKPVQTGFWLSFFSLTRFFRFWLGFFGLARFFSRFFFGLDSVRFFQFLAYKTRTEPVGFFKILISFFYGSGFFSYLFSVFSV